MCLTSSNLARWSRQSTKAYRQVAAGVEILGIPSVLLKATQPSPPVGVAMLNVGDVNRPDSVRIQPQIDPGFFAPVDYSPHCRQRVSQEIPRATSRRPSLGMAASVDPAFSSYNVLEAETPPD